MFSKKDQMSTSMQSNGGTYKLSDTTKKATNKFVQKVGKAEASGDLADILNATIPAATRKASSNYSKSGSDSVKVTPKKK